MVDNQLLDGCLICAEALSQGDSGCLSITTSDGTIFLAHNRCIEALTLLMKKIGAPPPKLDNSTTSLVYRLYREGWFFEPKELNEVKERISQMGFNFTSASIATALLKHTRNGVFTRQGKPRNYTYVQKQPPN